MCLEVCRLIVELLVLAALIVAAVYAAKSANAARRAASATEESARSTREMTRMQIFSQILDAYSSPKMLEDILKLVDWREKNPNDWAKRYGQMMRDKAKRGEVIPIHEARRHYAHHF